MSVTDWSHLPTVVIYDIYKNLKFSERVKAASVCKKWREAFFYYPSWRKLKLCITNPLEEKNQFLISKTSHFCRELTVVYVAEHYNEVTDVIKNFNTDNSLVHDIRFVGSRVPKSPDFERQFNDIIYPFLEKCNHITRLFLSHWVNYERMKRLLVKHQGTLVAIGLETYHAEASTEAKQVLPMLISVLENCAKIEQLCIDSRWLTRDMMSWISSSPSLPILRKLTLRLDEMNDIGEQFELADWQEFDAHRRSCEIHLNYVHITASSSKNTVRLARKITRLRMLYCSEKFRNSYLETLMKEQAFHPTIKSIWSISHPHVESNDVETDHQFVVCVWRYRNLSEIVLSGTKFDSYDLIGMSRLRPSLRVHIAADDIMSSSCGFSHRMNSNELKTLTTKLCSAHKKGWSPMPVSGFNDLSLPPPDREAYTFERSARIDIT